MMNKDSRNHWLTIILFPLLGLVYLGICFMTYFGLFRIMETTVGRVFNVGFFRQMFALFLIIVYFIVLRTKTSDRIKAFLLIGPLGTLLITVILTFYQNIPLFVGLIVFVSVLLIYILYRMKKHWYYYYASILAILAAIAYGWPRPY